MFLPKVHSQPEKQPGKLSLEDVHFKTTKADENREAECLCDSNCYQRFSANLLSNFSRDIINKTPVGNLCMSL